MKVSRDPDCSIIYLFAQLVEEKFFQRLLQPEYQSHSGLQLVVFCLALRYARKPSTIFSHC